MTLIPNPEYGDAPFEAIAMDSNGNKLPELATALLFGRIVPPRYKKLPDGSFEEVLSHIPQPADK